MEEPKQKLNPKQELFCNLYATEVEFFGNGVQSYIEAYEPDTSQKNWYKAACASASRLLSNVKVCNRINQLLEEQGLNDQNVDKQLLFLINQHADFKSKAAAIKEYNKLKQRITEKTQTEITINPITELTADELRNLAKGK
jgi:putative salt-induced outer membrane protein YdiY